MSQRHYRFAIVFALGGMSLPALAQPQDVIVNSQALDKEVAQAGTVALVAPEFVSSPKGFWTLLRRGDAVCAIRFNAFEHRSAAEKEKVNSLAAAYEWAIPVSAGAIPVRANIKSGQADVQSDSAVPKAIACAEIKATWHYPNRIYLTDMATQASMPIEIAPTSWTEIQDVRASDTSLVWMKFDPRVSAQNMGADAIQAVPVSDLPGKPNNCSPESMAGPSAGSAAGAPKSQ